MGDPHTPVTPDLELMLCLQEITRARRDNTSLHGRVSAMNDILQAIARARPDGTEIFISAAIVALAAQELPHG